MEDLYDFLDAEMACHSNFGDSTSTGDLCDDDIGFLMGEPEELDAIELPMVESYDGEVETVPMTEELLDYIWKNYQNDFDASGPRWSDDHTWLEETAIERIKADIKYSQEQMLILTWLPKAKCPVATNSALWNKHSDNIARLELLINSIRNFLRNPEDNFEAAWGHENEWHLAVLGAVTRPQDEQADMQWTRNEQDDHSAWEYAQHRLEEKAAAAGVSEAMHGWDKRVGWRYKTKDPSGKVRVRSEPPNAAYTLYLKRVSDVRNERCQRIYDAIQRCNGDRRKLQALKKWMRTKYMASINHSKAIGNWHNLFLTKDQHNWLKGLCDGTPAVAPAKHERDPAIARAAARESRIASFQYDVKRRVLAAERKRQTRLAIALS